MINWQFENDNVRRSYDSLPSGIYSVQIESAKEAISSSGNQMIKMVLGVWGHNNKVRHHLTFSPKHRNLVNKVLGQIYSSFGIPEGNLDVSTWIGKRGMAKLEQDTFNEKSFVRVAYFLTRKQQDELLSQLDEPKEESVENWEKYMDEDDDYYARAYRGRARFALS